MAPSQRELKVPDAEALEDDERQYGRGPLSIEELDLKYPTRPRNHSKTPFFHELFTSLFNPLNENKKRPAGPTITRAKRGRIGPRKLSPHEARRVIIEQFISKWRTEVGNDFYPALRLIIPEKDRDRAMYGLKEKAIGKLLVKLMKIDKNSEDGHNLLNWKLPGQTMVSRMAGDFAGRCFEVLSKRPMRTAPGGMRIAEVNELLDRLSVVQKEENQLPIFETFYKRMNPDELLWLIRIILRQMKVGATEKTFFELWHPDAEALFGVSSSLRRVCWELTDPSIRLEDDEADITLMQCFQPQLAQFQMQNFQKVVENLCPTEEDKEFWIEEKLDGERMQLHMAEDGNIPGGKRFGFWSRKAKDYTFLYGSGYQDEEAALTRHIRGAFDPLVRNIILDGEMITWDPESDTMVPFGTLKTAALAEQRNPFAGAGQRPLFRVFDILYLNDESLVKYTLRDRRKALEKCVTDVHRRLEVHRYVIATTTVEIEIQLRRVVAEASEGLVLKNPRSMYRLNSRNDDWQKVKPEYMTEFGESLDCLIIGGYYGSGNRGGRLSSFLCGLRVDQNHISQGANSMKFYSLFKVGGGFTLQDYGTIRHYTEGKWIDWDPKHPPIEFIELGGGDLQYERPDVWIKPTDSVVISVKAASVTVTDQFRLGCTVRFPRFKHLRLDRDWSTALSIQEFTELRNRAEKETEDKTIQVETRRKEAKKPKREVVIAGNDQVAKSPYAGPTTQIFEGLNFCIMTESLKPVKRTKGELEQLVKANGGKIFQSPTVAENMICIAEKRVVKVASLVKSGRMNIVKPAWLFDALMQSEVDVWKPRFLLPFEKRHMFYVVPGDKARVDQNSDLFKDSYTRDVDVDELKDLFEGDGIESNSSEEFDPEEFLRELERHNQDFRQMKGWLFRGLRIHLDFKTADDVRKTLTGILLRFAGAEIAEELADDGTTHILVGVDSPDLGITRRQISRWARLPRVVTTQWVDDCWNEGSLLDEERYSPSSL